ncbi:MAG: AMP-binding protein, partial [Ignavibacteriaceae bacterium]|nr:AMP-binding protein [Ignavibacteriaceae bacterium]
MNLSLSSIKELNEKLLGGKASLEQHEIDDLVNNLLIELSTLVKNNNLSQPDISEIWQSILNGLIAGGISDDFMNNMDKDLFFDFGSYLASDIVAPDDKISSIINSYLNLFRYSSFLQKIYDERRWDNLIKSLIDKSSYTFNVLFNQRVEQYKKKNLFRIIKDRHTIDYSWQKTSEIVSEYSLSIKKLLFEIEDENKFTAFLLENSLEMAMLDIACLTSGIVNVMIPANSVSEHIQFILNQTKAPVLFADDEKQLAKIRSIKNETPYLKTVILIKGNAAEDWVISFEEFKALSLHQNKLNDANIKPDSLATIMYTSGTTGEPKGIMFSHMNIVYKRFCRAMAIPGISDKDRYLAFLPLYHTFGRWLEMVGSIFWGAEYCFMENPSVETMIDNMRFVKPSIFISIPKKWIQLYEFITARTDVETDEDEKIKSVVVDATGGNLKWGLSAAGFLPPDVFRFFQRYGVELMSGFGMTEATGGITMTPPFQYRENSLGKALPGIEIKLGEDGEILISGPYVMINYFGQKKEEMFDSDGWLPTGDIMRMDNDGFIEIIDRKKEIYKNIKGETIAPQKIENLFRDFEFVKQVFLAGDHRPFNTVLIFPDIESANSPLINMDEHQRQEYFSNVIVSVNNFLAPFERIVDFRIISRPFDNAHNELTPKATYKRRIIEKNFADVIQSMYEKDHLALGFGKYEIKVPNWFLREKGALSRDISIDANVLSIPKLGSSLTIKIIDEEKKIFQIGNYSYLIKTKQIDLQDIFTNPFYWLGNTGVVEFAGLGIFLWFRKLDAQKELEFIERISAVNAGDEERINLNEMIEAKEVSIPGLHFATVMLQSNDNNDVDKSIEYFSDILKDVNSTHYKLVVEIVFRPDIIQKTDARRKIFLAALQTLKKKNFKKLLKLYVCSDNNFLNSEIINTIDSISRGDENLKEIESVLEELITTISSKTLLSKTSVPNLFNLLVSYGANHPASYEGIRRFILQFELYGPIKELRQLAQKSRLELRRLFTNWLGEVPKVSIDPETGEEYRWSDVLIFDETISDRDKAVLTKALSERQIIREAVFLISNGVLISLNNILPSGIWISKFSETERRSVFRVTIQTRFLGGFDIAIHLNHTDKPEDIEEEGKWKVIAGTDIIEEKIAAKYGGLWEDFNLWTEEFVGDESIERFIRRESKRNDELTNEKLRNLWKFFVWNASAAYVKFWKLSEMKTELAEISTDTVVVSQHDYQTKCIVTSFSHRRKSESLLSFIINFYEKFVKPAEEKYPLIKKASVWNAIFSGVIETLGVDDGVNLINKFRKEVEKSDIEMKDNIIYRIQLLINNIKEHGYLPKQLYFAVKRFHRWFELNKDASLSAQAEMIYELYDTYHLFDLEENYPAVRARFFLETVFYSSSKRFKNVLSELVRKQRHRKISIEESLALITSLNFEFELDEKETYFITRLGYPHLKTTDSAALIKIRSEVAGH